MFFQPLVGLMSVYTQMSCKVLMVRWWNRERT